MRTRFIVALLLLVAALRAGAQDDRAPTAAQPRFATYDVFLDAGTATLAAWQFELKYDQRRVSIVGLEGAGRAPYYDPAGRQAGRIVVADFTTKPEGFGTGRVRVCRLHLRLADDADPELQLRLMTAAKPGGEKLQAKLEILPTPKESKP